MEPETVSLNNHLIYLLGFDVSIVVDVNPICVGDEVTFTATTDPDGNYTYQWYYENTNGTDYIIKGQTNSTYTTKNTVENYKYYVMAYSKLFSKGLESNKIQMIFLTALEANVSVVKSPLGTICSGATVTFTATPTNGGSSPTYQWCLFRSETTYYVGTNSNIYTGNTFINNDIVYCNMTSNLHCCTINNPAESNRTLLVVTGNTTISVSLESNPLSSGGTCTICTGDTVTFLATNSGGFASNLFKYTWYVNDVAQLVIGKNQNYYSRSNFATGDKVKCIMSSGSTLQCVTISGTSNIITMDVTQKTIVVASLSSQPASAGGYVNICPYSGVTFIADTEEIYPGIISYAWHINSDVYYSYYSTYYSEKLNEDDVVYCVLTTSASCYSSCVTNTITVKYLTTTLPTVSIESIPKADGNPPTSSFCTPSGNISLTATTTGDVVTNYYWQKYQGAHWLDISGSPNSRYYSTGISYLISQSGNTLPVRCRIKTLSTCQVIQYANSSPIYLTVTGIHEPSVSIDCYPVPPFCTSAGNISFSATTTESVSTYEWQKALSVVPMAFSKISGSPNSKYYNSSIINLSGHTVRCVITGSTACLSTPTAISNYIGVAVEGTILPEIDIYADKNPICSGMTITFSGDTLNGGDDPTYDWYLKHYLRPPQHVGTNSYIYTGNTFLDKDEVYCVLTSDLDCASPSAVTSNTITITVNNLNYYTLEVTISPGTGICYGSQVILTAYFSPEIDETTYQWRFLDTDLIPPIWIDIPGETSNVFSADIYYDIIYDVVATSAEGCVKISDPIHITMFPIVTPEITIQASQNPICYVDYIPSILYSIFYQLNQGNDPTYAWWKTIEDQEGDIYMGSGTTMEYTPADGDVIKCYLTSSNSCASSSTVVSNSITMDVNQAVNTTFSITPSGTSLFCTTGSTISFSGVTNVTTATYQWYKKNNELIDWVSIDGADSKYFYSIVDNSIANYYIRCEMITEECFTPQTNYSNSAYIEIYGNKPVSLSIKADGFPTSGVTICSGITVTLIATPVNGGSLPAYQWYMYYEEIDPYPIPGATQSTYQYIPQNGDRIGCKLTSNELCATGNPATSDPLYIEFTVLKNNYPSVSISAYPETGCSDGLITLTATPVSGGTTPTYQWQSLDTDVTGGVWIDIPNETGSTYEFYNPVDGYIIRCKMWSSLTTCLYGNPATSNSLTLHVLPTVACEVNIGAVGYGVGTIQIPNASTNVDFNITNRVGNCGLETYQWYKNTTPVSTDLIYSNNSWINGDTIKLVMTGDCACITDNPATSNIITINITGSVHNFLIFTDMSATTCSDNTMIISDDNYICSGHTVNFTATTYVYTNPQYQWKINEGNVGTNSAYYGSNNLNNNDAIKCITTELGGANSRTSNTITMTVYQNLTPTVTIEQNPSGDICFRNTQNYHFQAENYTNSGERPEWLWYINGYPAQGPQENPDDYWPYELSNNDEIKLKLTSSLPCTSPVFSNTITVTVYSHVIGVTITADPGTVGQENTFTATPIYEGSSPVYDWYVNDVYKYTGNPYVGSAATFPVPGPFSVKCIMRSNDSCRNVDTVTSNIIVLSVNVGWYYEGGVICYIFQPGDHRYVAGEVHGIIASKYTIEDSQWGCLNQSFFTTKYLGYADDNTQTIVDWDCGEWCAGNRCWNYSMEGYTDCYLPTREDLIKIYYNKNVLPATVPKNIPYWSSTVVGDSAHSEYIDFSSGDLEASLRTNYLRVLPIRYF